MDDDELLEEDEELLRLRADFFACSLDLLEAAEEPSDFLDEDEFEEEEDLEEEEDSEDVLFGLLFAFGTAFACVLALCPVFACVLAPCTTIFGGNRVPFLVILPLTIVPDGCGVAAIGPLEVGGCASGAGTIGD